MVAWQTEDLQCHPPGHKTPFKPSDVCSCSLYQPLSLQPSAPSPYSHGQPLPCIPIGLCIVQHQASALSPLWPCHLDWQLSRRPTAAAASITSPALKFACIVLPRTSWCRWTANVESEHLFPDSQCSLPYSQRPWYTTAAPQNSPRAYIPSSVRLPPLHIASFHPWLRSRHSCPSK